jgi:hypothetical protein
MDLTIQQTDSGLTGLKTDVPEDQQIIFKSQKFPITC